MQLPRTATRQSAVATPVHPLPKPSNPEENPLKNPALPTDIKALKQGPPLPAPSLQPFKAPTVTGLPALPRPKPTASPNNILVIIPTENSFKTTLITKHLKKAAQEQNIKLCAFLTVPAESDAGEQPYDTAGLNGAQNRVINVVGKLGSSAEWRGKVEKLLEEHGIGTLMVGAVENFIMRPKMGQTAVPVDYGIIVLCRIPLAGSTNSKAWEWEVGISQGVKAPVEYWKFAESFGFDDGDAARNKGKVTVGKVLAANVPGLDHRDWHKVLADKSRYDILTEAMQKMPVPWPRAATGAGPTTATSSR
ncbi:hypothetical protein C8A03DRAFT_48469 [Achaetomium macrosporum]|uniref:Uncharacterized protein n=1 Tax=Achaetomium macrosporum TaxID=79813 RepID=A0AAN7H5Q6_9PEZI|nr:hypothetical protein C8A03DRAFT_48469 [Achaetomium macrosporum]